MDRNRKHLSGESLFVLPGGPAIQTSFHGKRTRTITHKNFIGVAYVTCHCLWGGHNGRCFSPSPTAIGGFLKCIRRKVENIVASALTHSNVENIIRPKVF